MYRTEVTRYIRTKDKILHLSVGSNSVDASPYFDPKRGTDPVPETLSLEQDKTDNLQAPSNPALKVLSET